MTLCVGILPKNEILKKLNLGPKYVYTERRANFLGRCVMAIAVNTDRGHFVIKITGRFELSNHLDFVKAYESIAGNAAVLDLKDAVYLDSAALGMMLAMREHLGGEKAMIEIINCSPQIQDILKIAHFSKLFAVR